MKKMMILLCCICLSGCTKHICDQDQVQEQLLIETINKNEQLDFTLYYEESLDQKSACKKLDISSNKIQKLMVYESILVNDPSFIAVIEWKKGMKEKAFSKKLDQYVEKANQEQETIFKWKVISCGKQDIVIVAKNCGKIVEVIKAFDA